MIAPYWTDLHPILCWVSFLLFSLVYQVFCDSQLALASLILICLTVCVAKLLIWFCGPSRSLEQAMFTLEILFSKHLHLLLATTCIQYVEIFPVEALQLKPTPSSAHICAWINTGSVLICRMSFMVVFVCFPQYMYHGFLGPHTSSNVIQLDWLRGFHWPTKKSEKVSFSTNSIRSNYQEITRRKEKKISVLELNWKVLGSNNCPWFQWTRERGKFHLPSSCRSLFVSWSTDAWRIQTVRKI